MTPEELNKRHQEAMADVAALNADGINIHGKKYTTVAKRVEAFRKHFGVYGRIRVPEAQIGEDVVSMRAVIELLSDGWTEVAEGRAEERRNASAINKTSAVEVCETSAIGRALANFGLHGGEYASANEVENAQAKQGNGSGRNSSSQKDSGPSPQSAERDDSPKVGFGKYRNMSWRDVPQDYLEWCNAQINLPRSTLQAAAAEVKRRKDEASKLPTDFDDQEPPYSEDDARRYAQ